MTSKVCNLIIQEDRFVEILKLRSVSMRSIHAGAYWIINFAPSYGKSFSPVLCLIIGLALQRSQRLRSMPRFH